MDDRDEGEWEWWCICIYIYLSLFLSFAERWKYARVAWKRRRWLFLSPTFSGQQLLLLTFNLEIASVIINLSSGHFFILLSLSLSRPTVVLFRLLRHLLTPPFLSLPGRGTKRKVPDEE